MIKGRQLICVTADHSTYERVIVIDSLTLVKILNYKQDVCYDEYDDERAMNDMRRRLREIGYMDCPVEHFRA